VLGVLLSFAVNRGRVFPALAWLALYGFLEKLRRITRRDGMLGTRTVQTNNAYVLRFPKGLESFVAGAFRSAPDHNNSTPSESKSAVKKGFQGCQHFDSSQCIEYAPDHYSFSRIARGRR
jgi:hypothetical protein